MASVKVDYPQENSQGSEWLRSQVVAKIYSGDEHIVNKLTQAQLNWQFYNNQHWKEHNDKLLSFNYCRALIDRINTFFAGKDGFEVNIENLYGDAVPEEIEKAIENFLLYNWRKNRKPLLFQKILQTGGITGDAYIFLYPNMVEKTIDYVLLDSRNTVPVFENGNYSEVVKYRIVTPLNANDKGYVSKIEEYEKGKKSTFYVKDTKPDAQKFEFVEQVYDIDFIPIVHIENVAMSDKYGGASDIKDIVKLNKFFNEMAEDVKDVVDYHASPVTVITGGTVGNLKRGLGEIWSGLPAEAQVFNLELNTDMAASMNFMSLMREAMHDLAGVPQEVLSKVQHISNTSAAALNMLYQSIVQAADKKALTYGEGLTRLHRYTMILATKYLQDHPLIGKLPEAARTDAKTFFNQYEAVPVFKYNLPVDRKSMLEELDIELRLQIASRREAMERLGKRNIQLIEGQISSDKEENVKYQKDLSEAMPKPASASSTPKSPSA